MVVTGKVSSAGRLSYSPEGSALCEFTLAVPQRTPLGKSVGNFQVLCLGEAAETLNPALRIGREMTVQGSLWVRNYRDRRGNKVQETKIIFESEIGGTA